MAGVILSREEAAEVECERRRIFDSGWTLMRIISQIFALLMVALFLAIAREAIRTWGTGGIAGMLSGVGFALVALILGGSLSWYDLRVYRKDRVKQLRLAMKRLGIRVCNGCDYDLRGVLDGRCPECGKGFSANG